MHTILSFQGLPARFSCAGLSADETAAKGAQVKYRFLAFRVINLMIIIALIGVYQIVALDRADREAAALAEAQAAAAEQKEASGSEQVYNDGTYTGSAQGYGGTITLEVTIENDLITNISAVSHSGEGAAYWDMASKMLSAIIEKQDPNVDTVSGATFTSTGIHNALTEALRSALNQQ